MQIGLREAGRQAGRRAGGQGGRRAGGAGGSDFPNRKGRLIFGPNTGSLLRVACRVERAVWYVV